MKLDCLIGRRYQIFFVYLHLQTVSYWHAEKSAFRLIPPSEEIDYFATYFNNKCYLVPIEECSSEKTLRFEPPANGQRVGITFAEDYELEKQITKLKGGSN